MMDTEEAVKNLISWLWEQYWWFFLLVLFWPILMLFVPVIKGKIGEGLVNMAARLRLDPKIYHLIKDVTIPTKKGPTQIDHIIVSKFGLFVVETKNYKGWIFADAGDAQWTQVYFKQTHRFQNPLRQNYAHICALSELLGIPKDKIHGVVCFMGDAEFKTPIPNGVFLEGRYINHIKSFQTPLFSETEVADLIRRIESGRLERGFKTNRAHVRRLHRPRTETGKRMSELSTNYSDQILCPACGAEMVLRTANRGANAGNQFRGCSIYPACKAVVKND